MLKTIKLELHPEKSKIVPLHRGVNLLGFRVFYHYKLLYKRNIRRFKKKVERLIFLYKNGSLDEERIIKVVEGWFAYAMWGNTHKFREYVMKQIKEELTK